MTMIEKVEQALRHAIAKQKVDPLAGHNYSGIIPPIRWDEVARTAIEAMRDPSQEMCEAPVDAGNIHRAEAIWHTMIDTALKEE